MDCSEIFEKLSEFIDEDLADYTCEKIEQHLKKCKNCRIVVSTMRKTVTLYHSMPQEKIPGEVRLRLHELIEIEKNPEK